MKLLTRKGRIFGCHIYFGKWHGFTKWYGNYIQFRCFGFIVITRLAPDVYGNTAIVVKG